MCGWIRRNLERKTENENVVGVEGERGGDSVWAEVEGVGGRVCIVSDALIRC